MRESLEHGFVCACHSATECVKGEDAMVQGLASVPKHGPLKPRETVLCEFVLARKPLARIEQGGISFAVISMCIRKTSDMAVLCSTCLRLIHHMTFCCMACHSVLPFADICTRIHRNSP